MSWEEVKTEELKEPEITTKDFLRAIHMTRPSVSKADIEQNEKWTQEFGSEGD